jgi:hypothetical protein
MRKAASSLAAIPATICVALLFGLVGGARAMEEGTCGYNANDGTCNTDDCTEESGHECFKHVQSGKPTHCDCVPLTEF